MLSILTRSITRPLLAICIIILHAHTTSAQCDENDFDFIKSLYELTNGDSWTNNTGWDIIKNNDYDPENCDLSGVYGITLDDDHYITAISLPNNNLTGVHPYYNLPQRLTTIDLSTNSISGEIFSEFGSIDLLININYANNEFTGDLPDFFSPIIEHLDFSGNGLSGSIPIKIGAYTLLKTLHLGDNDNYGSQGIENKIPEEFGDLTNLTSLSLHDNNLSGCYPRQLKNICSTGGSATISSGNNLADWDTFCASEKGTCSCNDDDFTILKSLSESTNIANWVDATGWQSIIDNDVCPEDYHISDAYGISVDENFRVDSISLRDNGLQGELPLIWNPLKYTTYINLSKNLLEGSIPMGLGGIPNLKDLRLHQNKRSTSPGFSGSMPITSTNFDSIEVLSLNQNAITGGIDPDLGSKVNLKEIWLASNQLKGSIPNSIGYLENLTTLRIEQNGMSGCYPTNLINICGQLTNYNINGGNNNFDDTWNNFCIAPKYSGVCMNCNQTEIEWSGAIDDQWGSPMNWEYACIPTEDTKVTIVKGEVVISGNIQAKAKNLDISTEFAKLTINSGEALSLGCNPCDGDDTFTNLGTIINNGEININSSEEDAISNFKSLINNGNITIDTSTSIGINNEGTIENNGEIKINRTNDDGLKNDALLTNNGTIELLHIWEGHGISNYDSIFNNPSAIIKIDSVHGFSNDGISIYSRTKIGYLENLGDIEISNIMSFAGNGVLLRDTKNLLLNKGTLTIGNCGSDGIDNDADVTNEGLLEITNAGKYGFHINTTGTFTNSGTITIDSSQFEGINSYGAIDNYGTMTINHSDREGYNGNSEAIFNNYLDLNISNSKRDGLYLYQSALNNFGNIVITDSDDNGIFLSNDPDDVGNEAQLINHDQGSILISKSNEFGLWIGLGSSFLNFENSIFTIDTSTEAPLLIEVGGILEGYPTLEIID